MSLIDKLTAQLPFKKDTRKADYFFALNIGSSYVGAALWEVTGKSVDILGSATLPYKDTEELIDKAHLALDKSLGVLEIEPNKILFGVPDSWLLDEDLKEPYLKLLRRMVKEYDLTPMAYVSTSAALAHYLHKLDGVPATAILIGIDDHISINVLRGGKVVSSKTIAYSHDLFEDVQGSLGEFSESEVLPSKMLLYSSTLDLEKLEKLQDTLISAPWMQRLSFLHLPKIEILGVKVSISAVVLAGAVEINPGIDLKSSFITFKQIQPTHPRPSLTKTAITKMEYENKEDGGFGFIKGDITKQEKDKLEYAEIGEEEIDKDKPLHEDSLLTPSAKTIGYYQSEDDLDLELQTGGVGNLFGKLKKLPFPKLLPKLFIIGAIIVGLILAYLFLVKAQVVIYVEPKVITRDAEVVADPKVNTIDEGKKVIPGQIVETTVVSSGKLAATGTKQIGDPSRGQVVLYNKTDLPKTFAAGSSLVGPNNLKFTLDQAVVVSSQSAVDGGISFGKNTTSITAVEIGPESNIAAGTQLAIGSFATSQYSAKVDTALSGGTAKEVTVVTAEDQRKLQAQVTDESKSKAAEELQSKMSGTQKIIADGLTIADSKFNFNKRVNDQAMELTLNATMKFRGTAYFDEHLKSIVAKLVETNVPEGFELNLAETETQADITRVEKDGRLVFLARFKAKLLPKFNLDELKGKINGKTVFEAGEILRGLESVLGSEIKLKPSVPNQIARLPFLEKNIEIVVTAK